MLVTSYIDIVSWTYDRFESRLVTSVSLVRGKSCDLHKFGRQISPIFDNPVRYIPDLMKTRSMKIRGFLELSLLLPPLVNKDT